MNKISSKMFTLSINSKGLIYLLAKFFPVNKQNIILIPCIQKLTKYSTYMPGNSMV